MNRGKPLERRSPLRSKTPLRSVKPGERVGASRKPGKADTGPSREVCDLVDERAHWCCEVCGAPLAELDADGVRVSWVRPFSRHHRKPRRMGGTSDSAVNSPANLLLVCGTATTGCHGLIEHQRALAYSNGWLLHGTDDPATTPALIYPGINVLLNTDGTTQEAP